ncbi:hypothetical protein ACE10Z_01480 [Bradyrhizobium sp. Pha-3]|uniref:hypothetical protein n=1 Tax=Bradyrhizobium sp. Pha-3 TaxID=208375 RepID=UPI0035D503AC
MGDITMLQVILARRHESIVIRVDGNSACESAGSRVRSNRAPFAPRMMRRAAPLWCAATLALTCPSDVPGSGGGAPAQSNGIAGNSPQLAQARTNPASDVGPAAEQPQSADVLARELAEKLKKSLKNMPQGDVADLQRSLREERGVPLELGNVWNVRRCDQGARSLCEG